MKITDLKCAVIGGNPIVRIKTDSGIDGLGQAEWTKPYLKPHVLFYRDLILGQDPTDVERVVSMIRRMGSFKPWGSAVSAIEVALWDIAGKAAGLPVYKLLGGKVRDRVRVYNGGVRVPLEGSSPEHYAEDMARMKELREGFSIIKQGIAFHSKMAGEVPDYFYGELPQGVRQAFGGPLTERGLKHTVACIEAMKDVLGDEVGLALDCGPGLTVPDALRLAKAVEPLNVMVAGGHDHRRLHALRSAGPVPRGDPRHVDADSHRRADIPEAELQGPAREEGGERNWPGPAGRRRHSGDEVGRRARGPAWDPGSSAWHR